MESKGLIEYLLARTDRFFLASEVAEQYGGDPAEVRAILCWLASGPSPLLQGFTLTPFGSPFVESSTVVFSLTEKRP